MSANVSAGLDSSATTEVPYTRHVEPPEQGGEPYLRCKCCDREVIGTEFERLNHKADCEHAVQ